MAWERREGLPSRQIPETDAEARSATRQPPSTVRASIFTSTPFTALSNVTATVSIFTLNPRGTAI
eukprot:355792-Chlamydomonas_euryale.AAC.11